MIQIIDIDLLVPFENHPFKERSGIEQQELTESIRAYGIYRNEGTYPNYCKQTY